MFGTLGLPEILLIGAIALLLFGPKQLPKLGKGIGESIREFRGAGRELMGTIEDEIKKGDDKKA